MSAYSYTAGAPPPRMDLDMYMFLPNELRRMDQMEGDKFIQRLFKGPQSAWNRTVGNILDIPNLWSITKCPPQFLKYLKAIVAWTARHDNITSRIDAATLRRLISVSAQIWKSRGPEGTLLDVVRLLFRPRARVLDWFDYRWITDETGLGEEHEGSDPWMVGEPGASDRAENWSTLRIVDDGSLDRTLLRDVVKLMRAGNERWEIIFLSFMDLFEETGDDVQWDHTALGPLDVSNRRLNLLDPNSVQVTHAIVQGAESWTQYMATAKFRGTSYASGAYFGLIFYRTDASNYYAMLIDGATQTMELRKVIAGVPTVLASLSIVTTDVIAIRSGQDYTYHVSVVNEGATQRIVVSLDGLVLIETTDAQIGAGSVGFYHDPGAVIEIAEAEVMPLPVESDTIELNA